MPLSAGQILNNRYRIVTLLGQRGFGAVYRAWDTNLDEPEALKESFKTSSSAQKRFLFKDKYKVGYYELENRHAINIHRYPDSDCLHPYHLQ
jgi:serine/threonine protein kinase